MEHDLELIIARLEILEIEVCNILYNPRNTGGGWAAPPARFSWLGLVLEHCSWKSVTAFENKYYFTIFKTWLRRPNHYAHEICIEILCRTLVSILKYLSPRPQNQMKNFKYSSSA